MQSELQPRTDRVERGHPARKTILATLFNRSRATVKSKKSGQDARAPGEP